MISRSAEKFTLEVCQQRLTMWAVLLAAALCAGMAPANSADLPSPDVTTPAAPPPVAVQLPAAVPVVAYDLSEQFEARLGAFYHGVGSREEGTFDASGSIVTPRLNFFGVTGFWAQAIPRLQLGGNLNTAGRTSFAYLDILYTIPITKWLFFEPSFGGAIHSGGVLGSPTTSDLGCHELFHETASLGVAINRHWQVLGTFEHLSNGKALGFDCGTNQPGISIFGSGNQGLNNYGFRLGYAF